jgi:hypothetical protein
MAKFKVFFTRTKSRYVDYNHILASRGVKEWRCPNGGRLMAINKQNAIRKAFSRYGTNEVELV